MARLPRTVDEYLADVPPRFRTALQQLRETIRAAAPKAAEMISYRMPAFRQHGVLVYYAAFKNHLSFFPGSALVRSRFASKLRAFEGGKGTYRFTPENPLPPGLVTEIVKARLKEDAAPRPNLPRLGPAARRGRPRSASAKHRV
jgi:uncharacterized protein YdhG (YjbR/CyaY superfamily)